MALRLPIILLLAVSALGAQPGHWDYAPTPPMGWNSWDIFGTTVTEKQVKEQADAMAKHLLPAGYDILTVDIQWYEPNSVGHAYKPGAPLEMDSYGRLLPGLRKFPSAANGQGFRPLADHVHSKGLRFGIHIMRGIPKQAARRNTPVLGTSLYAADIAVTSSTCPWNPDMFGVDASTPGGQAYYDSIFKLYASWGVDYVKVDDIARPYNDVQKAEIEAVRKAIDNSGRKMVLSLSPGATPIRAGEHVMQHANLWRITDDFWDRWPLLYDMFERTHRWTPYRTAGAWPDADMLPFGIVDFGRPTRFTEDEQTTCMSLWCIARSPLIFGGDMTRLDEFTTKLLTNPEVLAVNQRSVNNRQLTRENDLVVWAADVPGIQDKYVALFNAQSNDDPFDLSQPDYRSPRLRGEPKRDVIEIEVPINNARRLVLVVGDGGNGNSYDHAAWIEPKVTGSAGTLKLIDLDWQLATAGWGDVRRNRTADNRPLTLNGKEVEGIGTHAVSVIEFELPQGYDTFTARGMITEGSQGRGRLEFMVLVNPDKQQRPERSPVSVSFTDLGITGRAKVRDLWTGQDLGEFDRSFEVELTLHSAGLYRVSRLP